MILIKKFRKFLKYKKNQKHNNTKLIFNNKLNY